MKCRIALASFALCLWCVWPASTAVADLMLGQTVEVRNQFQGNPAIGPDLVVVTNSVEFPNWGNNGFNSLDILDDGFIYTSLQFAQRGSSPNQIQVTDTLNVIPTFASIEIVAASGSLNDPTRLFFDANTFWFDVGDLTTNAGDFVQVRVSAVPEPSAAFLVSIALAASVMKRRRPMPQ